MGESKKKRKKIPNQRMGESKKKRKEIPNQRMGERKRKRKEGKKAPDQGSKENRRNVQKGLWTGQYLNNTELSPNEQKEGKETMT